MYDLFYKKTFHPKGVNLFFILKIIIKEKTTNQFKILQKKK
jgi:hypothetical protein